MGQFGNQPDFGTRAQTIIPYGNPKDNNAINLKPAALYVGTGGTLVCRVVGGNSEVASTGNEQSGATIFENIPNCTFLPIIVTAVWAGYGGGNNTTCSNIVALY